MKVQKRAQIWGECWKIDQNSSKIYQWKKLITHTSIFSGPTYDLGNDLNRSKLWRKLVSWKDLLDSTQDNCKIIYNCYLPVCWYVRRWKPDFFGLDKLDVKRNSIRTCQTHNSRMKADYYSYFTKIVNFFGITSICSSRGRMILIECISPGIYSTRKVFFKFYVIQVLVASWARRSPPVKAKLHNLENWTEEGFTMNIFV